MCTLRAREIQTHALWIKGRNEPTDLGVRGSTPLGRANFSIIYDCIRLRGKAQLTADALVQIFGKASAISIERPCR